MTKIKVLFLLSALVVIYGCASESCEDFTEGKFKHASTFKFNDSTYYVDSNSFYITREKGYQVEHFPQLNKESRYVIAWKSASEYYLIKDAEKNSSFDKGDTINVEITDCEANSYRYTSTSKNGVMEGELIKIK